MVNEFEAAQNTIFGWPIVLMILVAFVLNFIIARKLTIALINEGFVDHKSRKPEDVDVFKKCVMAWFFPVIGTATLLMLLLTRYFIRLVLRTRKRLFLKHINHGKHC